MAAGIGSRFGGEIKQLEPVGPNGEIIMDYSIHDALEAGCNKVVFIIRKDNEKDFKEIRISTPLLFSPGDYEAVIAAITPKGIKDGAVLLVGHGTYTPNTAQYAMLDYMLKAKGFSRWSVGTIEGYPSFDDALSQIKSGSQKTIQLIPFMFVAGEHAKNDIAGDWKENLEKQGYRVDVLMEGLGQNPAIQDIIVQHARFCATHKYLDIVKKKKEYAQGKEKYE